MMNTISQIRFDEIDFRDNHHNEWNYAMRREMQEIFPGLFLGPYGAANRSKLANLMENGITHIVCIREEADAIYIRPHFEEHISYLVLSIKDSVSTNIIKHIPKVRTFLDDCFCSGGKVLIHGNNGISRSAALVIGYMMEKFGLPFNRALQYVQHKRFCVNPNEGFVQQLLEYEPIYKARQMAASIINTVASNKRKYCTEEEDPEDVEMSS